MREKTGLSREFQSVFWCYPCGKQSAMWEHLGIDERAFGDESVGEFDKVITS